MLLFPYTFCYTEFLRNRFPHPLWNLDFRLIFSVTCMSCKVVHGTLKYLTKLYLKRRVRCWPIVPPGFPRSFSSVFCVLLSQNLEEHAGLQQWGISNTPAILTYSLYKIRNPRPHRMYVLIALFFSFNFVSDEQSFLLLVMHGQCKPVILFRVVKKQMRSMMWNFFLKRFFCTLTAFWREGICI